MEIEPQGDKKISPDQLKEFLNQPQVSYSGTMKGYTYDRQTGMWLEVTVPRTKLLIPNCEGEVDSYIV